MKLLLTGGTGFFGKALLRHLQASEDAIPEVWVLSRDPEKFLVQHPAFCGLPWLRFIQGDILDAASLPYRERFSHVLHAATDSTLGPMLSPLEQYDQIVTGTRNLLDFALQCGVQRFLFTSSGAVYGHQPAELSHISEDRYSLLHPLLHSNSYGVTKCTAEHLCALYNQAHGLVTVVARCFAFVGPDLPLDVHFAIGNFIRDALRSERITVQGDGRALRSYMDQRDLARWLVQLLLRGEGGRAYNVGSDQSISIGDLAILVRDLLASEKQIQVMGTDVPNASRNCYVPSIDRAKSELGLHLEIPLRDAIRFAADVHKADKLSDWSGLC